MVRLNKIYTRTGDDGDTGLVGGARRNKADPLFEAIGTVDEANAAVGLARCAAEGPTKGIADKMLARIQNDLFDLGADLATPPDTDGALRVTDAQVERLEHEIDRMNDDLEPLTSFVLPGGTEAASRLHLARTIVRRAERHAVAAAANNDFSRAALRYLNRLSDHLFVLARHLNHKADGDVLWVPGGNDENA